MVKQVAKAIVAAIGAFGTGLMTLGLADAPVDGKAWLGVIGGALATAAAAWGIPNADPPAG